MTKTCLVSIGPTTTQVFVEFYPFPEIFVSLCNQVYYNSAYDYHILLADLRKLLGLSQTSMAELTIYHKFFGRIHWIKHEVFYQGFLQQMWQNWLNLQIFADLFTFTEEILKGKLNFLCSNPKCDVVTRRGPERSTYAKTENYYF